MLFIALSKLLFLFLTSDIHVSLINILVLFEENKGDKSFNINQGWNLETRLTNSFDVFFKILVYDQRSHIALKENNI